jgi:polyisoprenoid-binding protein YceI
MVETVSSLDALLLDGKLTGSWTLDPARSEIRLKSRSMWGLVPVKGVFREISGQGSVSEAGDVTGSITVAAASIDTKQPKRDAHLRSADFFDAGNHPDITFTVGGVRLSGQSVTVTGELTVRGQTRPLSFEARVPVFDGDEVSLDADVQVNRADFGLVWNQMGMASMSNTISVHAVFTR